MLFVNCGRQGEPAIVISWLLLRTFLVVMPRWLLCLLNVLSRKPTSLHLIVVTPNVVPRVLISYSSPWRWVCCLVLRVLSRKPAGLHLILVTPKIVPRLLISCLSLWRWLRCLCRKLTRLHLIIKLPQPSLTCGACMMEINLLLIVHLQNNKWE